ncbi:hypothetical protein MRB53_039883 [Persea americana]|nr:hypothetical protein MRB53_039883 [Persea americana]
MFAYRDQENLVDQQQQAAAAKPLNQGIKGLAPKTPGNTFKSSNNGRTQRQEDENRVFGTLRGAKQDKLSFVTPAPRERAPLGVRTTNAKAFQTPLPFPQKTTKRAPLSTSAKKPKLRIHQTPPQEHEHETSPTSVTAPTITAEPEPCVEPRDPEDDLPDIELFAPRPTPLEDLPEHEFEFRRGDFQPIDRKYLFAGFIAEERQKQEQQQREGLARSEEELMKQQEELCKQSMQEVREALARSSRDGTHGLDRDAAEALSMRPKQSVATQQNVPRFARPTAAANARTQSAAALAAKRTPGDVASRSTIGYARGRKVASVIGRSPTSTPEHAAAQRNMTHGMHSLDIAGTDDADDREFWDLVRSATESALPRHDDAEEEAEEIFQL